MIPLVKTGLTAKRFRRNKDLRNASPEESVKILEEIAIEAIHAQNTNSKAFQQSSLEELKQLRQEVLMNKINTGSRRTSVAATFTGVINQLEKTETVGGDNERGRLSETIANSMPSADTFIAALMTANPILGYGTKIIKDIGGSLGKKQKFTKTQAREELDRLKKEEQLLAEEEKALAEKSGDNKVFEELHRQHQTLLIQIREEIRKLYSAWEGTEYSESGDIENLISVVEKVEDNTDSDSGVTVVSSTDQGAVDDTKESKTPKKKSGILDKILDGMSFGVLGSGLLSIAGFISGLGGLVTSVATKLFLPLAVIKGIYDFFDGFFNMEKYLGVASDQLSILDRGLFGIVNIFSGLASGIDSLLEMVGIDLFDSEELNVKIYNALKAIPDKILSFADSVQQTIQEFINSSLEKIKNIALKPFRLINSVKESVEETISKTFDNDEREVRRRRPRAADSRTRNDTDYDQGPRVARTRIDTDYKQGPRVARTVVRSENMATKMKEGNITAVNAPVNNNSVIKNTTITGTSTSNNRSSFRRAIR